MKKVLFVCTGNICRSPMAEAIMRAKIREAGLEKVVKVSSAGTIGYHEGEKADSRAEQELVKHGVEIGHVVREVSEKDLAEADLVIGMDRSHLAALKKLMSDADFEKKVKLFGEVGGLGGEEVPDPYYAGGFEKIYEMLDKGCDRLVEQWKDEVA